VTTHLVIETGVAVGEGHITKIDARFTRIGVAAEDCEVGDGICCD